MEFKDGYLQGKKIVIKGDEFMKRLVLIFVLFFMATAPVGAHLITRAAYNHNEPLAKETLSDEWAEDRKNQN